MTLRVGIVSVMLLVLALVVIFFFFFFLFIFVSTEIRVLGGDVKPFTHHNSRPEQLHAPIQTIQFSPTSLQCFYLFFVCHPKPKYQKQLHIRTCLILIQRQQEQESVVVTSCWCCFEPCFISVQDIAETKCHSKIIKVKLAIFNRNRNK